MNLTTTLLFYLTIGLGTGVAVTVVDRRPGAGRRVYLALTALLFWPLYVPLLLTAPRGAAPQMVPAVSTERDGMAAAIAQVECELAAAFAGLDGWAENVLDRQRDHLHELGAVLELQAARIREMDTLAESTRSAANELPWEDLATTAADEAVGRVCRTRPDFAAALTEVNATSADQHATNADQQATLDRFRQSQQARLQNLARLAEVRRAAYTDLMATLAWIRELVSMIHLAKFTGAPAARAEELVAQIAAAVEGISAANWHEAAIVP